MHKYGDCSFCGGEVKEERVELDYRYKRKLFIFKDVPSGVCQQCGEKYLTSNVVKKIEQDKRKMGKNHSHSGRYLFRGNTRVGNQ